MLNNSSDSDATWESVIRIMGKREAENFVRFFLSLCLSCLQYIEKGKAFVVALVTRRCHVLFEIFWKISHRSGFWEQVQGGYFGEDLKKFTPQDLEKIYLNYFITDNALLASVDQLAKFYQQNKDLPELIIVDELLIHGRALNHFLLELEERLADAIRRQTGSAEAGEKAAEKVEEKLHLKIFARNKSVLLLLFRYAKEGRLDCFREYEADKWKTLSLHFARVVSIAPVNNVAYTWSFTVDDDLQKRLSEQRFLCKDVPFHRVETEIRGYRQTTDLLVYPTRSESKVLFTVRRKKSLSSLSNGEKWLYVPYMVFDQLQWKGVWNLHQRISKDILAFVKSEDDPTLKFFRGDDLFGEGGPSESVAHTYYRWCVQTNELVLNGLMMRVWMEQHCGLPIPEQEAMIQSIDWDYVGRNYNPLIVGGNTTLQVKEAADALPGIWKFIYNLPLEEKLLESYLTILTEDAGRVLPDGWKSVENCVEKADWKKRMECAVQQTIYDIGLDAEKNAYDRYGSGLIFSERTLANWGDHYSLQDVVAKCIREYTRSGGISDEEMDYLLALITQAMDLGQVGMEPLCGEKSLKANTEENVYTLIRAGEQSLFIAPFRYRTYLPTLSLIEKRYQDSWADESLEIRRFVRRLKNAGKVSEEDSENLYCELRDFVKGLYLSGQTVSLWNDVQLSEQVDKESYSAWSQTVQDGNDSAAHLKIYRGY